MKSQIPININFVMGNTEGVTWFNGHVLMGKVLSVLDVQSVLPIDIDRNINFNRIMYSVYVGQGPFMAPIFA